MSSACVITMAPDRSGDYRTVPEAVDAVSLSSSRRTAVLASPGVYKQPVYFPKTKNLITVAGNNIRGGLPDMRCTGRLQNPDFEVFSSLGSHLHPSYLHNDQLHLHHIQPPMQATESINFNPRLQIPSSSYRHQMNYVRDGNRNIRPSIPTEQRTNQRNPPPEVSRSFGRHPAIRILDDVMLMDGVRNSDISNRWFNNEDVPYEELLNLQRQLPRVNTADFSRINIDDGNRNFRPSVPIDQRTNHDSLTTEVSGIGFPATHLQDDVLLMDDAFEVDTLFVDLQDLDIQELLGHVRSGLSEETILRHLKTRTHVSSANHLDFNEGSDQAPEICVICQGEYENHEKISTLQCGHAYHVECIMKWLQQKNVCPICKAKALPL